MSNKQRDEFLEKIQETTFNTKEAMRNEIFQLVDQLQQKVKNQKNIDRQNFKIVLAAKGLIRSLQESYGNQLECIYLLGYRDLQDIYIGLHYILTELENKQLLGKNQGAVQEELD